MVFDPTKPVQSGGYNVRIIATDLKARQPIVCAVTNHDGSEFIRTFNNDGTWREDGVETGYDLINVHETKSWWVGIYESNALGNVWPERHMVPASSGLISVLEIRMCDGKLVECIQHEVEK